MTESCNSMTECRVKMWRSKTWKSGASPAKLYFLGHHDKWTGMVGSLTTYPSSANSAVWYDFCTADIRPTALSMQRHGIIWPVGVALQHVSARTLQSSVCLRVRKPVKNPLTHSRRKMNPKILLRTQMMMICDETIGHIKANANTS